MTQSNKQTMLSDEFEQMRSEYAALKEEMDGQQIVDDTIMERILKRGVRSLNFDRIISTSSCLVFAAMVLLFAPLDGTDRWAVLSVVAFLLIMALWSILYRKLGLSRICQEDVLTAALKVRKFRRNYIVQTVVSYVMTVVLLCVFIIPAVPAFDALPSDKRQQVIVVLCVFLFLAVSLQCLVDRKVLSACSDIINCLDDRSKDESGDCRFNTEVQQPGPAGPGC